MSDRKTITTRMNDKNEFEHDNKIVSANDSSNEMIYTANQRIHNKPLNNNVNLGDIPINVKMINENNGNIGNVIGMNSGNNGNADGIGNVIGVINGNNGNNGNNEKIGGIENVIGMVNGRLEGNTNDIANNNFKGELLKLSSRGQNNGANIYFIRKKKNKPKCKVKRSVTLIRKPNHNSKIYTLRKECV